MEGAACLTHTFMFNLEQSISNWRRQMRKAGITNREDLDELESHLRDEIDGQMRSGHDEPAAFELAMQQMGQTGSLTGEFRKVGAKIHRVSGVVTGVVCVPLTVLILALGVLTFSGLGMTPFQEILALQALGLTLLIAFQWRRLIRYLPIVRTLRGRIAGAACANALVFGLFNAFTHLILPHLRLTDEPGSFVALFWAFIPVAAVLCLTHGFVMSVAERREFAAAMVGADMLTEETGPRLGTGERLKQMVRVFAGIPDPQFSGPAGPAATGAYPEPRWATYLKTALTAFPALFVWLCTCIFVLPKLRELCLKSGTPLFEFKDAPVVFQGLLFVARKLELLTPYCLYIGLLVLIVLSLLEWRSALWPRYRRAVLGTGIYLLNAAVLVTIALMVITALLAVMNTHAGK